MPGQDERNLSDINTFSRGSIAKSRCREAVAGTKFSQKKRREGVVQNSPATLTPPDSWD